VHEVATAQPEQGAQALHVHDALAEVSVRGLEGLRAKNAGLIIEEVAAGFEVRRRTLQHVSQEEAPRVDPQAAGASPGVDLAGSQGGGHAKDDGPSGGAGKLLLAAEGEDDALVGCEGIR